MKQQDQPIGYQIAQLCRAHRQRAETALNELGLHVGQEMILLQLWREEAITQTHMAEVMCVEPPTVTKMLNRMVQAGLVERHPDPEDARVSRVYLTEHGRQLEQPVLAVWRELEERTLVGLSLPEQLLLRRLLSQIYSNLE